MTFVTDVAPSCLTGGLRAAPWMNDDRFAKASPGYTVDIRTLQRTVPVA